jgi:hypothetical protein
MPRKSPAGDEVAAALARLLRRGLPVTLSGADDVLLDLGGIVGRAVDPADRASRLAALDGTLRGLLARFQDARYASAARALFGLPPAEPGQNLTVRRDLAAAEAGHEVHHFRKRVEPKLIEHLAWDLLADADRFTLLPMVPPRLAPVATRQPVPADPFAWEVTEQEEQLTRLWSALYAARAELLRVERLVSFQAERADQVRAAVTAAWRWAAARTQAISYISAYDTDSQLSVERLLALAGWVPALTDAQFARLAEAAAEGVTRRQFVGALHDEIALGHAWVDGLLGPGAIPDTSTDTNGSAT